MSPRATFTYIRIDPLKYPPVSLAAGFEDLPHYPRTDTEMPPKRKAPPAQEAPKPRLSKLARENNVTAQEESEIREAFSLFAEPMDGEKYGVIPTGDVRSAMIALGIPPKKGELAEFTSILDPDSEGHAQYEPFFAICALKFHARDHTSASHASELQEAYDLFTHGSGGGPITVAHLRRVAALLREEVGEDLLRDMILEANGGVGVEKGVGKEEFDDVMRRAGVWR
ncbi:related to calmodulin [Cephalotrichum gorgonifer]|uniref:Related to calmodulin n=1 Tax=Cephalotrichum gorgonifer TaxID=2041049 RepID=A0AAE8SS35_9PEZI|nr:related to calmodulin [Cephalotrichum gorgonifer]